MKANKLAAFFVISVLVASVLYPLSAIASPHDGESSVVESQENKNQADDHPQQSASNDKHDKDDKQAPSQNNDKKTEEHNPVATTQIPQTGPDEGDNKHPSGKDRSIEPGNSQTQGKSQSDPDGVSNSNGGTSGKDKIGFDGGFDKGDQDNNNGCGNDDDFEDDNNGNCKGHNKINSPQNPPQKNPGGCDKDGSTGDKNGKPCNPGKNNASLTGCQHGEPDCNKKSDNGGKDNNKDNQNEEKEKNENSSNGNSTTISNTVSINNQISINNQQSSNITNHKSTQSPTQVLGASVLAATGDYLLRIGLALIVMGAGTLMFGLFLFSKKAFNKVFNRSYQTYLYLYET